MRFNLEDYEPVQSRIKRFKADHPDSRIITHALSDPNLKDWVVIRTEVFLTVDAAAPAATGIAQEQPGSGANQTSWWENCETSSIGRALANCGYGGDKRASREEMEKAERPAYGSGDRRQAGLSVSSSFIPTSAFREAGSPVKTTFERQEVEKLLRQNAEATAKFSGSVVTGKAAAIGEIKPCRSCGQPVRMAYENGKSERYNADGTFHFRSCGTGVTGYEQAASEIDAMEADPFAGN